MNKKRMLLAACLISAASWASAQVRVTGTVVSAEDGQPVVGASVIVPGTKVGTVTDINGHYSLQVPEGHKNIRVSSIGMEAQTIQAKDNAKVVLQGNANALDEVVVTGYGNFKKSSFTGAAASMSTEKLNDVPSVSIEDKLAGNIPGVSMSTSSGQPGAVNSIVIRGMGSINAGNDPLIVIDGTPVQSGNVSGFNSPSSGYNSAGTNLLSTLNSNDIASMTVIKDAAAASLYGSRAANGVIVITTKSGQSGKTKVDFRSDWGFSNMAINYRPTLSGDDRRALIYQGLKNYIYDGQNGGQTDEATATAFADKYIDNFAAKPANGWSDWRDALFHTGSHQNYQASISGGNANTQFYASLAYTKQNGIVDDSGLERMTGNANVTHRFGAFKLDVTSLFSKLHQSSNMEGTSFASPIMNAVWIMTPSMPIYNEDGTLNTNKGSLSPLAGGLNPLYEYDHQYDITNVTRAYNTVGLEWNIWDALKLREKIAYDYTNSVEDVVWDQYSNNGKAANGNVQRAINEYSTLNTQTQLSYTKTFNKHNVDALLGFETEDWTQKTNYQSGNGYYGNLYEFINATTTTTQSWKYQSRLTSFLGRVNYNYDNMYYLGASFRRDGSSRMARENRWGDFWSVSGAWRFGGESFIEPIKNVLTDGKLRVSYGVNGTLPSGLYNYINQFTSGEYYNGMNGMGIVGVVNKNLKWEQNKALNIGLDLTFFNRLSLTADYYIRKTSDLIMNRPISYVPGYYNSSYSPAKAENVGSIKNSGIEITLQSTNIQTKDFTWTTSLNIAHNRNKVTELSGQNEIISGVLIHRVGQPYYSYYLYEYAGVDPQTGLESYYINDGSENSRKTTTNVNEAKKVLAGKHDAAVEGGLTNFMKWKFIDFNFTLTYKLGGDSFDYATWLHDNGGTYTLYGNIPSYYKLSDMWQKPGDNAKLPKFQALYGTRVLSSRWLMPNDYLRVKNLTLGFSVPQNYIQKLGMTKARIYFSANNLLTWKSSKMLVDPETPSDGLATFETPSMRTYTFGVELSF